MLGKMRTVVTQTLLAGVAAFLLCGFAVAQKSGEPRSAQSFYNRGLAEMKYGECDAALEDFDRAIELDPRDARFYKDRGRCLSTLHRDEALSDINKAIELRPGYAQAYAARGSYYIQKELVSFANDDTKTGFEFHSKALADLDRSIALDPRCAECYIARADLWPKSESARLLADINKAVELAPTNTVYLDRRARFYVGSGEYQKSIADCDAILKINRRDYSALTLRGQNYSRLKDYRKAVNDYTRALQIEPKLSILLLTLRSQAYRALGNTAQAEADERNAKKPQ